MWRMVVRQKCAIGPNRVLERRGEGFFGCQTIVDADDSALRQACKETGEIARTRRIAQNIPAAMQMKKDARRMRACWSDPLDGDAAQLRCFELDVRWFDESGGKFFRLRATFQERRVRSADQRLQHLPDFIYRLHRALRRCIFASKTGIVT